MWYRFIEAIVNFKSIMQYWLQAPLGVISFQWMFCRLRARDLLVQSWDLRNPRATSVNSLTNNWQLDRVSLACKWEQTREPHKRECPSDNLATLRTSSAMTQAVRARAPLDSRWVPTKEQRRLESTLGNQGALWELTNECVQSLLSLLHICYFHLQRLHYFSGARLKILHWLWHDIWIKCSYITKPILVNCGVSCERSSKWTFAVSQKVSASDVWMPWNSVLEILF